MVHTAAPGVRATAWGQSWGLTPLCGNPRVLHSVLYGVGVYDWPTMLTVVLVLAAVALIAAAVPSVRVARISPAQTLRDE